MTDRTLIEKLKIEKKKWENQIYGVGETRIDLMIDDVIRELQTQQEEIENKDKIIDLMAEEIVEYNLMIDKEYPNEAVSIFENIEDAKEYFINKVEKENK